MLQGWNRAVDNGKLIEILLTDLPKALFFLSHELLLSKLHAYGFSISVLRLIYRFLANRKQKAEINSSYSSWEETFLGFLKDQYQDLYYSTFLFAICLLTKTNRFCELC